MSKLIKKLLALLTLFMRYSSGVKYGCCFDAQWKLIQLDAGAYRLEAEEYKWPAGIIYYDVDPHLDQIVKNYFAQAVDYINGLGTCVRWVERRADGIDDHIKTWVSVYQITESPGRSNPVQASASIGWKKDTYRDLVIETHYVNKLLFEYGQHDEVIVRDQGVGELLASLLHEMMHVMGFRHEHQRPDRDCFIYVAHKLFDQPSPYVKGQRKYYTPDFPYDYESILHYSQAPGFFPHDRTKELWRIDGNMSEMDIQKIKYLYCDGETWCQYKKTCDDPFADLTNFYRTNPLCYRQGQEYSFSPNLNCKPCEL